MRQMPASRLCTMAAFPSCWMDACGLDFDLWYIMLQNVSIPFILNHTSPTVDCCLLLNPRIPHLTTLTDVMRIAFLKDIWNLKNGFGKRIFIWKLPCWGSILDLPVASLRQGYNATVLAYGQTGLRFRVGLFIQFCKQQLGTGREEQWINGLRAPQLVHT